MIPQKSCDNSLPQWKYCLERAEIEKTNHSLLLWLEKKVMLEGISFATNYNVQLDWVNILNYETLNMICDHARKALLKEYCKEEISFEFKREKVHVSHFLVFLQKLSKASRIPYPLKPDSIEMLGGIQNTDVFIKKIFSNENRAISILSFF